MDTFVIRSSVSEAQLVFSQRSGEDFVVGFESRILNITQPVCGYTNPCGVARILAAAAALKVPWKEPLIYASLEGELIMSVSCDSLGHVDLKVEFCGAGSLERWSATASVQTELGQLPQLAMRAKHFFGVCDS